MVEFFKCFLPQISLGPFLNIASHLFVGENQDLFQESLSVWKVSIEVSTA